MVPSDFFLLSFPRCFPPKLSPPPRPFNGTGMFGSSSAPLAPSVSFLVSFLSAFGALRSFQLILMRQKMTALKGNAWRRRSKKKKGAKSEMEAEINTPPFICLCLLLIHNCPCPGDVACTFTHGPRHQFSSFLSTLLYPWLHFISNRLDVTYDPFFIRYL